MFWSHRCSPIQYYIVAAYTTTFPPLTLPCPTPSFIFRADSSVRMPALSSECQRMPAQASDCQLIASACRRISSECQLHWRNASFSLSERRLLRPEALLHHSRDGGPPNSFTVEAATTHARLYSNATPVAPLSECQLISPEYQRISSDCRLISSECRETSLQRDYIKDAIIRTHGHAPHLTCRWDGHWL